MPKQPPYTITPAILRFVADISELIGHHTALTESQATPRLRRDNRIRTIHASLGIENNTLSLEQVTAVIDGKRVLGDPREIQEVRNAFAAYEAMESWNPASMDDLLEAHRLLMTTLTGDAGQLRFGGVGIFRGDQVVHMAPPAKRIPKLIQDLLDWLRHTEEHPLISSCVTHYELEFIHPFSDGNGRMGRLWQTLILRHWKPLMAYLPVESVIHERQQEYYQALATSDQQANATTFIEFMLAAILDALKEAITTDPVSDPVSDPVAKLLNALEYGALGTKDLMTALHLSHRHTFRKNYLRPALEGSWIERTLPETPNSPAQRYRLTAKGKRYLNNKSK